jgi:hypothetical protein
MSTSDMLWKMHKAKARRLGRDEGRCAASYHLPGSPEDALEILIIADREQRSDGTVATLDEMYRAPDLSGEFADDPTDVWEMLDAEPPADADEFAESDAELSEDWVTAASEAFYGAIVAQAADYLRSWIDGR